MQSHSTATSTTCTTCPYCGVGCGIQAQTSNGQLLAVSGDASHPSNLGRLCIKGSNLPQTLGNKGRVLYPSVDGQRTSWDQALQTAADRLQQLIHQHGPGAVAFYLSGQLLTEDYYVANKLMKGFIGSSHVDTNSRLCMASTVAGHKRAFGTDAMPGCYEDLEQADLLILVGSNAAWNHPVLYQRILAAKQARPHVRLVVIDPRRTASCELADLHLALKPGTDALLFNALLVHLAEHQQLDHTFVSEHTEGLTPTLLSALDEASHLQRVAETCDLSTADLQQFFAWFTATPRTVTLFSQGINQSSSGTDKVNAIINCHLATGRIGKPGSTPFSLTGQPNAMGGREVGGLANQLAAHMDFTDPQDVDRVARFWQASNISRTPGYKAVALFQAIERGEIKAVWIMGTNPLVSLPDSSFVHRALSQCELVMVSESVENTDTLQLADIVFPASSWSEKNGTVTNSERRISRQRGFLPPPGEARHDWDIICQLARYMGYHQAFNYQHPAAIFREHAALSGFENNGSRCFDISALSQLSDEAYDQLQPVQWPVRVSTPLGTPRLFADGHFFTASNKARFVAITARPPEQLTSKDYPLRLNTGRIRDQWHTMTRTGRAPHLLLHRSEPFVEVHPDDAASLQLKDQGLAQLSNPQGDYLARVRVTTAQRRGEVFVPMHWNRAFSKQGLCNSLIQQQVDPVSGQPESKQGCVALQAFNSHWQALLITRHELNQPPGDYWVRIPLQHCTAYRLAGLEAVNNWTDWCLQHLQQQPQLLLQHPGHQELQAATLQQGALHWLLYVHHNKPAADLEKIDRQFGQSRLTKEERRQLLQVSANTAEQQICSCFQISDRQIQQAIQSGCNSVEALGKKLRCGTNCGSCVPEIKALLEQEDCYAVT